MFQPTLYGAAVSTPIVCHVPGGGEMRGAPAFAYSKVTDLIPESPEDGLAVRVSVPRR